MISLLLAVLVVPTWPTPTSDMKPWVINWWPGSAVTERGLDEQVDALDRAGVGGFRVIPIYAVTGNETNTVPMLSERWLKNWSYAVRAARKRGLEVDLSFGPGWCFGGPWITESLGVQKLVAATNGTFVTKPAGTGVKRTSKEDWGWMLDPFSREAMSVQIAQFEKAFDRPDVEKPRAFCHDSFEYFGASWTPKLPGEFAKRRGYPLKPEEMTNARTLTDYRLTLEDLVLETFGDWTDWCRRRGILTCNQAHGAPGCWMDFYDIADIPETEMFGDGPNVHLSKFASSVAHVRGTKRVGAETFTWIDEHFRETPAKMKAAVDGLFLAGVNHVFIHGCCYSDPDAPWPGWLFYAATEFNPRNPLWSDAIPKLNAYVTRCQSLSQTSDCDNDLLVYQPLEEWWLSQTKEFEPRLSIHDGHFYYRNWYDDVRFLEGCGAAFDFVSGKMLTKLPEKPGRYRTIFVPRGISGPKPYVPPADERRLAELERGGYKVIRGDREEVLKSGIRLEPTMKGDLLYFTRYRRGGHPLYFIANTSTNRVVRTVRPSAAFAVAWMLDAMSGRICRVPVEKGGVALTFDPLESVWLELADAGDVPQPEEPVRDELLLGAVHDCARVWLNGVELGVSFMPPFRYEIPDGVLKPSGNRLECVVTTRAWNRVRELDRQGVEWKKFYFVNRNYQPFEPLKSDPLPEGVEGPVRFLRGGKPVAVDVQISVKEVGK